MEVRPMGMLLMLLAGWVNWHKQDVIEYLKEENKILREKMGTETRRSVRRWFRIGCSNSSTSPAIPLTLMDDEPPVF